MTPSLKALLLFLVSRDMLHTYFGAGALAGIGYGLDQMHRPTAIVVVSSLLLAGIVYARTRGPR